MIKVTLIRPTGCQHCIAVKTTLEKMKGDYLELTIEEIDMTTPEGQALVQKYNILSSPGILVNDEFFAFGGATEEQFKKKFDELKK
ncbi:thioredoxin [Candidatus Campbellbacteria bacterium CG10_big_fil_rev_8_21_14_0_10_35_52]|uniref:Thioredoxin n=1 Tax=Candidatus Campbellbacteria bacterium CG10_big_fil_rev_8_21_14_0_10_35_52 TaxID=1974527 RepID=A0A2M6WV98_9BACT|nr:MAG: thioredoxin [Candidatus Campbellbacteria bacterium CG10_big_fil_rev_8_21_14_0_10_35_52]